MCGSSESCSKLADTQETGETGRRKTSANLASGCGDGEHDKEARKKTILLEADFLDSFPIYRVNHV